MVLPHWHYLVESSASPAAFINILKTMSVLCSRPWQGASFSVALSLARWYVSYTYI